MQPYDERKCYMRLPFLKYVSVSCMNFSSLKLGKPPPYSFMCLNVPGIHWEEISNFLGYTTAVLYMVFVKFVNFRLFFKCCALLRHMNKISIFEDVKTDDEMAHFFMTKCQLF